MEFDIIYLFVGLGFMVLALGSMVYLVVKGWMIDREIKAKERFLEDNPAPKEIIRFVLHDN